MAAGLVSNWGNDANTGIVADANNITAAEWKNAKRTFQGAKDAGFNPVYAKGYISEYITTTNFSIIGDNTIFEGQHDYIFKPVLGFNVYIYNCLIKNADKIKFGYLPGSTYLFYNSEIANIKDLYLGTGSYRHYSFSNSLVFNSNYLLIENKLGFLLSYSTFSNISEFILKNYLIENNENCIFSNLNFNSINENIPKYSLFINSSFKFTGGGLGTDETVFTYPTGTTDYDKLQNLRDRMVIVYGGQASDYLIGCKYYSGSYNDIFNDADNGDFTLVEGCIAANMSYDGSYIGAKPVGANIPLTSFTTTNLDVNGRVIDQELDATAESSIIDIQAVREIENFQALGDRAARNGQHINTVTNLGSAISPGTNVLTNGEAYMCIDDVITLDDSLFTSFIPWETFTAKDEGSGVGLGFSAATIGKVQQVLVEDYNSKILLKSSKTDASLSTAPQLTFFLHEKPYVNVDITGIPTHGNADIGFDDATKEALYTRYMQYSIKIEANSLPAR